MLHLVATLGRRKEPHMPTPLVSLSVRVAPAMRDRIAALAARPYGKPDTAGVVSRALEVGLAKLEDDAKRGASATGRRSRRG